MPEAAASSFTAAEMARTKSEPFPFVLQFFFCFAFPDLRLLYTSATAKKCQYNFAFHLSQGKNNTKSLVVPWLTLTLLPFLVPQPCIPFLLPHRSAPLLPCHLCLSFPHVPFPSSGPPSPPVPLRQFVCSLLRLLPTPHCHSLPLRASSLFIIPSLPFHAPSRSLSTCSSPSGCVYSLFLLTAPSSLSPLSHYYPTRRSCFHSC